jgi:hypothetical protein
MEEGEQGRFAALNEQEISNLLENVETKNTKRQNNTAVKLFRQYLAEKKLNPEFETYSCDDLDSALSSFYMEMRGHDGQMYKKTTMQAYRQGLQRHIEKTTGTNITDKDNFKKSTQAFKAMTKELKRVGLAAIEHHPPIDDSDLEKMYDYFCQNLEDAQLLQYKVSLIFSKYFFFKS